LIARANALRDRGQLADAFSSYAGAIAKLEQAVSQDPLSPAGQDTLASAWANQGLAWRISRSPHAHARALESFDRAIALREGLLKSGNPLYRYNLAGVWINRADVLIESANPTLVDKALAGYDRALAILAPLEAHPLSLIRRRVAVARMNRAGALLAKAAPACVHQALAAVEATLGALAAGPGENWTRALAALARTHRAEALMRLGSWEATESSAREALLAVGWAEDAETAAIALRARSLLGLCLLRSAGVGPGKARFDEAVDCAEEGLRLAAQWHADGRVARGISELFRLAAEGYARRQPQFVAEFLEEHLSLAGAAAPERARGIASRAVAAAMGSVTNGAFQAPDAAQAEDYVAIFRELRRMAERLAS
jgi:tetratricopeptide (TPR) repeat protein